MKLVVPLVDGVYVDVTCKGKRTVIGFSRVEDREEVECYHTVIDSDVENNRAELRACLMAKERWPSHEVFCDNEWAAAEAGVTWIAREFNELAHKTARGRRGVRQ